MSYEELLTSTCSTKRPTETTSASGEAVKSYTTYLTGQKCLIQAARGALRRWETGEVMEAVYTGFFLLGVDLKEDDQVIYDGVTYLVLFVDCKSGHHLEAVLSRGHKKS